MSWAWRRDRAFDRDLAERVLLMARIADFREFNARACDRPGDDHAQFQPHLAAPAAYRRLHHPPAST